MSKLVGLFFLIVVMVLVCLSYSSFVVKSEAKKIISNLLSKLLPNDEIPEFVFEEISADRNQSVESINSCHWHQ
ncbi:MAG: hypothetical protein HKO02_14165 [Hyphomonadaceae bacterium]|nr:hypothetical protein [Hyphomonadaceae bacterium]